MKLNWFRVHVLTARSMGRHLPQSIEDYIALGVIYTSEITGSGGHAAHPHRSIDSVSAMFVACKLRELLRTGSTTDKILPITKE